MYVSTCFFSSSFSDFVGEKDLQNTATEDGVPLPDEEDDDGVDEEEDDEDYDNEMEVAGKYYRFFEQHDDKKFVLFVELGIHRVIEVRAINDYTEIELKVTIPLPPDGLFHAAGFPNATQCNIENTEEIFIIQPPRNLTHKKEIQKLYPNEKTPLYAIFTWELSEEIPETVPTKVEIDLYPLLTAQQQDVQQ